MKLEYNKSVRWIFGWINGADAYMLAGVFLTLIWFVVDWCMSTTFRSMSSPQLYLINFTLSLLLLFPWMVTRNRIVGLIVMFVIAMVCEANLIYYRTYFTAIPPGGYLMAGNMMDFTDSIWPNLRWSDLGFVVIFTATVIAFYSQRNVTRSKRSGLRGYAVTTCIFSLISFIYIMCLGGFYKAYDNLTTGVTTYTLAGHIVFRFMEDARLQNTDPSEVKAVDDWICNHKERYMPNPSINPRKNVVLVICESMESWPIGLEIEGKPITPFLNSLVGDSTTFYAPYVMTQVGCGHSIDGQLIYTTGLLPTSNNVYSYKYLDRIYPSLNKILKKDRNTKSIVMTIDKPQTWNMMAVERAFGYDTVLHRHNWKEDEIVQRKISDGSFFRQSVAELKKGELWTEDSPVMLTFVTYSGHYPFKLKDELKDKDFDISKMGLPRLLENYITMTHYVDSQLKTIVDYIKSRNDFEETMIVILGDHEGLGMNRKTFLENSEFAREHVWNGRYTPMLVVNAPVNGRYDEVMGQIDVFPTILDFLGVSSDEWRGVGVSVLDPSRPAVAISASPLEMDGDVDSVPADVMQHIKSAQSVSEMIIMHDLYGKRTKRHEKD